MKNKYARLTIFVVALVIGTYAYLYPGSAALLDRKTDIVMGDGTDSASLPYGYDFMRNLAETNPIRLFYGAVYLEAGDPERGQSLWIPWNERFISIFMTTMFPIEQISTAFIFSLFLLNGLAMYFLCRYLKWDWWVSVALSFAWAFNVYTRARAKVHGALVGIYHIPLIFLALLIVVRGKSKRSVVLAAALLLAAATVAHYYLVTCIFLSPLFILFVWMQPETRADWKRIFTRFAIASIPTIMFLGSSYYLMLPPEATLTKSESIAEEVMPDGSAHPFLEVFHAYPIDFLAGDLGLVGDTEVNPLREVVNDEIRHDMGNSNYHERSNGIRWSVIALGLAAFFLLARGRFSRDPFAKKNLLFFAIFGIFTFWLSMAPDVPTPALAPSFWLYKFFPKIRVSSRAGIMFHFSLLMAVGFLMTLQMKRLKWLLLPGALFGLFLVDYFPIKTMPMAPVFPAYSHLHRSTGKCETGMVFPYITPYVTGVPYYFFAQRLRGSDCKITNASYRVPEIRLMLNTFPPDANFLKNLNPSVADKVVKLAQCMPLNWIVFLDPTPKDFSTSICSRLGWTWYDDGTCAAADKSHKMERLPSQCL